MEHSTKFILLYVDFAERKKGNQGEAEGPGRDSSLMVECLSSVRVAQILSASRRLGEVMETMILGIARQKEDLSSTFPYETDG